MKVKYIVLNGMIGKLVDGTKYDYISEGSKVVYEEITNGSAIDKIVYNYGDSGLVDFTLNGTEYFYIRNAQSDIIGIINSIGEQVVSYTYYTWGKLISVNLEENSFSYIFKWVSSTNQIKIWSVT